MRILHTADWHLGRIFHEVHLTDDQAILLDQFTRCAIDTQPDVILITGDIYDRAVPPPDAVCLLDETLHRLVVDVKRPVIMIAGNHDSPDRLAFGSRLLAKQGVHIIGTTSFPIHPLILYDSLGPVYFYPFPHTEPSSIRERTGDSSIRDYQSAYSTVLDHIRENHPRDIRSVFCAHATVFGAAISDSERPLSIGGTETVDSSTFDGFSFVALGHLHRRQWQGPSVHYAGSLMKYSFSESDHQKSVSLVEIGKDGSLSHEYIPLTARRDVRVVKGLLSDILTAARNDSSCEDYIMAILENIEPQLDAIGKLRQVYPNLLHIERPGLATENTTGSSSFDHRTMNDLQLFDAFFHQTTGNPLSDQQKHYFEEMIDTLRKQEREL